MSDHAASEAWRQVIKREEKQHLRQLQPERAADLESVSSRAPSVSASAVSSIRSQHLEDRLDRIASQVAPLRNRGSVSGRASVRPGTGLSATSSVLSRELDAERQRRLDAENEVTRLKK